MEDKRKSNGGGGRRQGRKKMVYDENDTPKNTTVRVKPSVVLSCRKIHGSLTKALIFASKNI